jgi:alkylmercury lyase
MQLHQKSTGIEIRPGVFRPDWSAVTTAAARDALLARFKSRDSILDKWSVPLNDMGDHLWRCALSLFADLGRGPTLNELAAPFVPAGDHGLANVPARLPVPAGFDTATEVALLGMSATQAPRGRRQQGKSPDFMCSRMG